MLKEGVDINIVVGNKNEYRTIDREELKEIIKEFRTNLAWREYYTADLWRASGGK